MGEKGSVTGRGGSGLLTAGVVIAVVIAAGAYMNMRSPVPLTEEDLAAVIPAGTQGDAPAPVAAPETAPAKAAETAPEEAAAQDTVATQTPSVQQSDEDLQAEATAEAPKDAEAAVMSADESAAQATVDDAQAPSIDEVRVEGDGVAVIAGRAAPGSDVEVVVDGNVVATTRADSTGSFAALGTVDVTDGPQVLSLRSTQDEQSVVSRNEVIIAPVPGLVATPTPSVEPEAEADSADVALAAPAETEQQQAPTDLSTVETAAAEPSTSVQDGAEEAATTEAGQTTPDAPSVAPEAPAPQIALLQSDEEGVSLLQTAPTPPSRVVLDTIGYSDSGVVQLAGRASSEAAEVRIYLNNRAVINLPVDTAGGWRGAVPDIDAGVYTLRVDEVTAEGSVASRIETPFKREEPEVLARATRGQSGPVTAVTVQTGDTLWAIARERYGEGILYVRVFDANRSDIRDPDLIYPGQVFDLPDD